MHYALVYPMFAMVLLSFTVLVTLFRRRTQLVRAGDMSGVYYYSFNTGDLEPASAANATRHFSNLLETPVLFYVGATLVMVTNMTNGLFVLLAWLYVMARLFHAYVHMGRNRLRPRIAAYFVSWVILLLIWFFLVVALSQNH